MIIINAKNVTLTTTDKKVTSSYTIQIMTNVNNDLCVCIFNHFCFFQNEIGIQSHTI